ncbi:hypothetical protein G7Y89_g1080 [Cudoniella acicularis]|uniref:SPX domain-containing protein n=1 Tax=Cudoniella acicularis TaxID=354080 RepID=A0A8H4W7R4_9HELO|nr:hypothetical protein G7Y89_g1080 [Cudoniella acicularis]
MDPALVEGPGPQGLRIAVEGCGHGTLDAIYASVQKAAEVRGWDGVDLLIIGGDFQAVRNASDLTVMSCPVKYREIGDFYKYYSGVKTAPYPTVFVGGNHEASSHLWELFYGGWVAPNIYYMGAANVVRLGGVRIAGMSGIWKGYNFNKHHHERLPYNQDDIKSIYHVREIDTRKLLQLRSQIDIGISHDWPRAIEKHGNSKALFSMKSDFEQESKDGTLGNQAAAYVMDRLRPPYWFAAHMHCKFSATKTYEDVAAKNDSTLVPAPVRSNAMSSEIKETSKSLVTNSIAHNTDEIDLDMDDDEVPAPQPSTVNRNKSISKEDEIDLDNDESLPAIPPKPSSVPSDLRAQLPAAFARPSAPSERQHGQLAPPEVTNKTVRFLALDKCLPGRKFLQLLEVHPYGAGNNTPAQSEPRAKVNFEYDPEWLAITRVFAPDFVFGDKSAALSRDLGEAHYLPMIEKEWEWVDENIVKKGKLGIPENFTITAPIFEAGMPEIINEGPVEYNNPQMQQFCELVGIGNKFFATDEEREVRMKKGPAPEEERRNGGFGRGGGRGGGRDRGRRGRGGGRGRGRGRAGLPAQLKVEKQVILSEDRILYTIIIAAMKFGRNLPRNQVPEWSSSYINYKGLKKLIKAAVALEKTGKDADLAEFLFSLDRNLEDVDDFYNKKFADASRRLKLLQDRYTASKQGLEDLDQNEHDELMAALLELRGQLRKLQWFGEVNRRGFMKITKKLDKKVMNVCAQHRYLASKVDPRPFATNSALSLAMKDINDWLEIMGEIKTKHDTISVPPTHSVKQVSSRSLFNLPNGVLDTVDQAIRNNDVPILKETLAEANLEDDDSGMQKLLVNLLQRCISCKSKKCIGFLLKRIKSLDEPDDLNHRNCLHRLVISIGRAKSEAPIGEDRSIETQRMRFLTPAASPLAGPDSGRFKESTLLGLDDESVNLLAYVLDSLEPHQRTALKSKDAYGRFPLHYAAQFGFVVVCELVMKHMQVWSQFNVEHGIDAPEWQDDEGLAPLHLSRTGKG